MTPRDVIWEEFRWRDDIIVFAIADDVIDALDEAGFVIVPKEPTKAMISACCDAMRKREEEMGDAWFPVSAKTRAVIRWDAMIAASQEPRDD